MIQATASGGSLRHSLNAQSEPAKLFSTEHRTTSVRGRTNPLLIENGFKIRAGCEVFERARLRIEPTDCRKTIAVAQLRALHGPFEHTDGFIVDVQRHREWVAILAAVRKRKACRTGKAGRGSVDNFRYECKGGNRAGADAGREQKLREVLRPTLRCRRQSGMQAFEHDVREAHVMVRGHMEMWEDGGLRDRLLVLGRRWNHFCKQA